MEDRRHLIRTGTKIAMEVGDCGRREAHDRVPRFPVQVQCMAQHGPACHPGSGSQMGRVGLPVAMMPSVNGA